MVWHSIIRKAVARNSKTPSVSTTFHYKENTQFGQEWVQGFASFYFLKVKGNEWRFEDEGFI